MNYDENLIAELVKEIRKEQTISPKINDDNFRNFIVEAMYNINYETGEYINFINDLDAKSLLKNYVLYARYNRLAEFKELYRREYASLQFKYNNDSNI